MANILSRDICSIEQHIYSLCAQTIYAYMIRILNFRIANVLIYMKRNETKRKKKQISLADRSGQLSSCNFIIHNKQHRHRNATNCTQSLSARMRWQTKTVGTNIARAVPPTKVDSSRMGHPAAYRIESSHMNDERVFYYIYVYCITYESSWVEYIFADCVIV